MKIISTVETIEVLDLQHVYFINSSKGVTRIHLAEKKVIETSVALSDFDSSMYPLFYRTHSSYIINLSKIIRYYRIGIIELDSGIQLPVSRRRRNAFIARLTYLVDNDLLN